MDRPNGPYRDDRGDAVRYVLGALLVLLGVWFIARTFLADTPLWFIFERAQRASGGIALILIGVAVLVWAGTRAPRMPRRGVTLYRSRRDKVVSGVLGGLAVYLDTDATMLRLLYVALTFFTGFGFGLVAYLIASVIIPLEPAGGEAGQPYAQGAYPPPAPPAQGYAPPPAQGFAPQYTSPNAGQAAPPAGGYAPPPPGGYMPPAPGAPTQPMPQPAQPAPAPAQPAAEEPGAIAEEPTGIVEQPTDPDGQPASDEPKG